MYRNGKALILFVSNTYYFTCNGMSKHRCLINFFIPSSSLKTNAMMKRHVGMHVHNILYLFTYTSLVVLLQIVTWHYSFSIYCVYSLVCVTGPKGHSFF